MKNLWSKALSFGLLAFSIGLATAAPTELLYIDDIDGNIGTVNLNTKEVTVLGDSGEALDDIGFTSDGNLYGASFSDFYSINKTSGAASLISSFGATSPGINALVGAGSGLYAASYSNNQIYSIGVSPFSFTALTGATDGDSAGDLAFASAGGSLYETLDNGDLDKIAISGGSFTTSVVANTGNDALYGLATADDGTTYAIGGTEIYTINLGTAILTPFFDYGGFGLDEAYGTAFLSEAFDSPEPSSYLLVLGGLGILVFSRKRRGLCSN